jgi:hypothetical protein
MTIAGIAGPLDLGVDLPLRTADPCPAGARFIFAFEEDGTLTRFNPDTLQFFDVGGIACPTRLGGRPNSMAVDRGGNAWVNFDSGELFRLITATATCTGTTYAPGQGGLVNFGMSFAEDSPGGSGETLFVSDRPQGTAQSTQLGTIDVQTFMLKTEISLPTFATPELTGDGQANLWGFFPDASAPMVARIDKLSGVLDRQVALPGLAGQPRAWAFAAWGGDFFIFLQRDFEPSTTVYRLSGPPDTNGALDPVVPSSGRHILGVGVATCASDPVLGGDL